MTELVRVLFVDLASEIRGGRLWGDIGIGKGRRPFNFALEFLKANVKCLQSRWKHDDLWDSFTRTYVSDRYSSADSAVAIH